MALYRSFTHASQFKCNWSSRSIMNENGTTMLCDPDNMDRQYYFKKDEQYSLNNCGPRMIIACLVVQALSFGICLIVLIAFVSNATMPATDVSQLSSRLDAIETLTNQLVKVSRPIE